MMCSLSLSFVFFSFLFLQRNLVHLKYREQQICLKPKIYSPDMILMIPEACKTL